MPDLHRWKPAKKGALIFTMIRLFIELPFSAMTLYGVFMSSRIGFELGLLHLFPMHASYVHFLRSVVAANHELVREVALAISNAAQIQKYRAQLHFAPMRYVFE